MPSPSADFLSVKLPAALVQQAREKTEKTPDSLQELKMLVLAASTSGALKAHVQNIVRNNRQQGPQAAL